MKTERCSQSGNAGGEPALQVRQADRRAEDAAERRQADRSRSSRIVEKWIAGQLLETATGKGGRGREQQRAGRGRFARAPDGPPPMPGELPLEPVVRTRAANALTALAASPWAPLVAVGGQKQIILYNTETLEPLGVLPFPEGFPAIIRSAATASCFSPAADSAANRARSCFGISRRANASATVGNEVRSSARGGPERGSAVRGARRPEQARQNLRDQGRQARRTRSRNTPIG